MKRKLLVVAAGTMILSLAGCGGNSTAETTAAPATEAKTDAASAEETKAEISGSGSTWEPTSTVSIVVPAGAGGDTDLTARVFAQYAKEITGSDFIVVNANGAAGSVAAKQVLDAAPDGHTFLYGHNLVNVANIAGVTDYNYTAFKLGPTFAKSPAQQFYVNAEKYADLDAFIEAAKAAPGQLKACTEVGAYTYYELLAFEKAADVDLNLVDVGSNSDKIAAMLSGQVDLMPGTYLNCQDYVTAGQFVCIGMPTEERFELTPDIPTLKEQGIDEIYPDLDYSFYFPKDTPDDIIGWYDELVQKVLADDAAQEAIAKIEMLPYYLSPADSEQNDEQIYNTIKKIAESLQ